MKRTIQIAVVLFALLPGIAKAQWTFDIVSVEAYINAVSYTHLTLPTIA